MANELFCCLCLILRLGEARVSATNAKGGAPEKVQESLAKIIPFKGCMFLS